MPERIRRRNLPHWDVPGAAYFITTCLEGSIPAQGFVDLAHYRTELANRPRPDDLSDPAWKSTKDKLQFARLDQWLDTQPAVRWLENPTVAQLVVESFFYYAGTRYDLLAYVVMPSHIHWVFQPRDEWISTLASTTKSPREKITHALNTHTAREANPLLSRTGPFWQHEGYDHWIRDTDDLERIIHYIENNPVKAALITSPADWLYSSAHHRQITGQPFGVPLLRPSRGGKLISLPGDIRTS